jgi:Leucine-rich repeat (LRR) protein
MEPITCTYRHEYSNENVFQGEVYGIHVNKIKHFYTIDGLMKDKNFDNISYLSLNSVENTRYHPGLDFKYPKKLEILHFIYDDADDVNYPEVPEHVTILMVIGRGLPKLPRQLKELHCRGCRINELPELPESLEELRCSNNPISTLPILPNTLKILSCNRCELSELPELHEGLLVIECMYNKITKLPELPTTLMNLSCNSNNIIELPFSLKNCDMSVKYDTSEFLMMQSRSDNRDKYEYFIFSGNPIHKYINNNYCEKKNGVLKKVTKARQSKKIGWYFKKLKAVQTIENEYIKRRYDPQYGFCKYMVIKGITDLFTEREKNENENVNENDKVIEL